MTIPFNLWGNNSWKKLYKFPKVKTPVNLTPDPIELPTVPYCGIIFLPQFSFIV